MENRRRSAHHVALKDVILDKIHEGSFGMEGLKDYFTVFTEICNNTEDIQDEVEGFDRTFLFRITGMAQHQAWRFEMGSGDIEGPDMMLDMRSWPSAFSQDRSIQRQRT